MTELVLALMLAGAPHVKPRAKIAPPAAPLVLASPAAGPLSLSVDPATLPFTLPINTTWTSATGQTYTVTGSLMFTPGAAPAPTPTPTPAPTPAPSGLAVKDTVSGAALTAGQSGQTYLLTGMSFPVGATLRLQIANQICPVQSWLPDSAVFVLPMVMAPVTGPIQVFQLEGNQWQLLGQNGSFTINPRAPGGFNIKPAAGLGAFVNQHGEEIGFANAAPYGFATVGETVTIRAKGGDQPAHFGAGVGDVWLDHFPQTILAWSDSEIKIQVGGPTTGWDLAIRPAGGTWSGGGPAFAVNHDRVVPYLSQAGRAP